MAEELSEQQKIFAEAKAEGKTGEEAVERAGYKSRGKAARVQATRLLANDNVSELIAKLREQSRSKAVKTAQDVKEGLSRLMDKAEAEEDHTGFVALANRLAKMEGHYEPERHQISYDVDVDFGS